MIDILNAFLLIFIAEMGDKTQLMAMAFATKYKIKHILIGVAIGASLNHGIAIAIGTLLGGHLHVELLQFIAGIMFIIFGLFSLNIEEEVEEEINKKSHGPIITVALAFFIGELGDKTQLTALALSLEQVNPVFILMGTTMGMVLVSLFGVFVGVKLGDKIPEHKIKMISASVFFILGLGKVYGGSYGYDFGNFFMVVLTIIIGTVTIMKVNIFRRQLMEIKYSALQSRAEKLKTFRDQMNLNLEETCLNCSKCEEGICSLNYIKSIIQFDADMTYEHMEKTIDHLINKDFKKDDLMTLKVCLESQDMKIFNKEEKKRIHQSLAIVEKMILEKVEEEKNLERHIFNMVN